MQLFDELPMLWGSLMLVGSIVSCLSIFQKFEPLATTHIIITLLQVYALITHLYETLERSALHRTLLKLSLFSYGLVCTTIYLSLKTPILFQVAYGILVTLMLYFDICVVKYKQCNVKAS